MNIRDQSIIKKPKTIIIIVFILSSFCIYAQEWQDVSLSIESDLNDIYFTDINHGWIIGDSGTVLKYKSGTWNTIDFNSSNYNLTALHFIDSLEGWIVGENGIILNYFNDTISIMNSPTNKNLNDIYMIDDNNGWIVGHEKTLLKFLDGEWTEYPTSGFSNDLGNLRSIQFTDSTFGIIIGGEDYGGFTILNYENGTWYEDNNPTNTTWLRGLYVQDKENIFTSENQILPNINIGSFIKYNSLTGSVEFISSIGHVCGNCRIDFGNESGWAICSHEIFKYENSVFLLKYYLIDQDMNSICMVNDTVGWIVGDSGVILKYNQISNIDNTAFTNTNIYPNPVQGHLNITTLVPIDRIDLFDIYGCKVQSIKINNEFFAEMSLHHLPEGIYILQIKMGNSSILYKVVKK